MIMPLASTQKEVLHVLATQVTAAMESPVKVRKRQKLIPWTIIENGVFFK